MAQNIYDRHRAAFGNVSAYVIISPNGERVASVAFKFGSGGQVQCYLHLFGLTMARGTAGGGGYDKASAAFYTAMLKVEEQYSKWSAEDNKNWPGMAHDVGVFSEAARKGEGGAHWDRALQDLGFKVYQAV